MTNSLMRRLSALAICAVVALGLPAAASAMPIIDTGPVVEAQPADPPSDSNTVLLLSSAALATIVLAGVTFGVARVRPTIKA